MSSIKALPVAFWPGLLLAYGLRFVLGFRKDYQLLDGAGNRRLTRVIATAEQAWRVVFAYVRRWQIELRWQVEKSLRDPGQLASGSTDHRKASKVSELLDEEVWLASPCSGPLGKRRKTGFSCFCSTASSRSRRAPP
jgi:hypothetical protein